MLILIAAATSFWPLRVRERVCAPTPVRAPGQTRFPVRSGPLAAHTRERQRHAGENAKLSPMQAAGAEWKVCWQQAGVRFVIFGSFCFSIAPCGIRVRLKWIAPAGNEARMWLTWTIVP